MRVWIAIRGERHEGAHILGVFATKALADQACAVEVNGQYFSSEIDYVSAVDYEVEES